jgi:hypothetical protein
VLYEIRITCGDDMKTLQKFGYGAGLIFFEHVLGKILPILQLVPED